MVDGTPDTMQYTLQYKSVVCMYTHINVHKPTRTLYMYIYMCVYQSIYIYIYAHIDIRVCIYIRIQLLEGAIPNEWFDSAFAGGFIIIMFSKCFIQFNIFFKKNEA